MFIFIILSASMSGMPSKACQFLGTTKIYILSYYFCALILLYMYLIELLWFCYTFKLYIIAFCCCYLLTAYLYKQFLYMCNGMTLPSLPMSTLYGTITLFWPADIFRFAVYMEQFLLKRTEFIFTKSMLFSSALS